MYLTVTVHTPGYSDYASIKVNVKQVTVIALQTVEHARVLMVGLVIINCLNSDRNSLLELLVQVEMHASSELKTQEYHILVGFVCLEGCSLTLKQSIHPQ